MTINDNQWYNPLGPWQPSTTWTSPSKTVTKVTETREYDGKGNLVKETVVTETIEDGPRRPDTYVTYNVPTVK